MKAFHTEERHLSLKHLHPIVHINHVQLKKDQWLHLVLHPGEFLASSKNKAVVIKEFNQQTSNPKPKCDDTPLGAPGPLLISPYSSGLFMQQDFFPEGIFVTDFQRQ